MKIYILFFTASGKQGAISVTAEINGKSTLMYKVLVDDKILEWLKSNGLALNTTKILDINLFDERQCNLFNQEDMANPSSIILSRDLPRQMLC